jgi:hypothetical protein
MRKYEIQKEVKANYRLTNNMGSIPSHTLPQSGAYSCMNANYTTQC